MFKGGTGDWGAWVGSDPSISRRAGEAWGAPLPEIAVGGEVVAQFWRDWEIGAEGQVRGARFTAAVAPAGRRRAMRR
eukprot:9033342-Pyramimonas_sp.AAC.1